MSFYVKIIQYRRAKEVEKILFLINVNNEEAAPRIDKRAVRHDFARTQHVLQLFTHFLLNANYLRTGNRIE